MCGIAGIYGKHAEMLVRSEDIDRMCDAIYHRGPDDQGMYIKGQVGLGMRRLSIIDLTTGQQPMHNEDRTISVVFNGEIYNFIELRDELAKAGHRFYTHSDTEVLPHLYEEHGAEFVKKLRGMFAIALYDETHRRLILARDRLGKKPLVYSIGPDRLLFASEIRSILAIAPNLVEIDREALLSYFQFGYIPDPQTAFRSIRRLPPGHILVFEHGKATVSSYWSGPEFVEEGEKSEDEWLELLEDELAKAVRMRLISDVPLGALLSGGVDSSTIVALMAHANASPVKTFSISFRHGDYNEGNYALKVARTFGTDHHELTMEPDFHATLDELTSLLEEPFGDSSMLPTYYVSKLVRQHVTVALSGDGGDELFAGYDRYAINLSREAYGFIPQWAGRWYRNTVFPRLARDTRGRRFLYNVTLPLRDRYLDSVSFMVLDRDRDIFAPDFLAWADQMKPPRAAFEAYFDGAPATTPLSRLQFLDLKTYLASDILPKVDRMSMAASLETRAPMLDHVFVELSGRVPASLKLRGGSSKYLLKRLAERLGVPKEVIYRRKQGFAVPLVHWFREELKDDIRDVLTDSKSLQRGYLNPKAVTGLLEEHGRGMRDRSAEIWLMLVFELWHRNFLEPLQAGTLFQNGWGPARHLQAAKVANEWR
jgi:asparagine synthase (glutamine-hydrolysing)